MATGALVPRLEMLDEFVELLSEIDTARPATEFYDRICEAVCRLTSMERAGMFIYDEGLRRVRAVGTHGLERRLLASIHGTLEETPMAQRALAFDAVQEIHERHEEEVPARYTGFLGVTTLTCTPLSAAGRWFGVIFADRGGGRFNLTAEERHVMWTLGKLAALAASARIATRQQDRARRLSDQIGLARDIHERVMQRLFAVSLVLHSDEALSRADRDRAREEIREAVGDLRTMLERPLAPRPRPTATTLRAELERLSAARPETPIEATFEDGADVPANLEPLAQSILSESLRNAGKHARPSRIEVRVSRDGNFVLEIRNDGVSRVSRGVGMGLRLAAFEALQFGGVVEFGLVEPDWWRVRLVVPLDGNET
jgi:signal transduction histidine kinase